MKENQPACCIWEKRIHWKWVWSYQWRAPYAVKYFHLSHSYAAFSHASTFYLTCTNLCSRFPGLSLPFEIATELLRSLTLSNILDSGAIRCHWQHISGILCDDGISIAVMAFKIIWIFWRDWSRIAVKALKLNCIIMTYFLVNGLLAQLRWVAWISIAGGRFALSTGTLGTPGLALAPFFFKRLN